MKITKMFGWLRERLRFKSQARSETANETFDQWRERVTRAGLRGYALAAARDAWDYRNHQGLYHPNNRQALIAHLRDCGDTEEDINVHLELLDDASF